MNEVAEGVKTTQSAYEFIIEVGNRNGDYKRGL